MGTFRLDDSRWPIVIHHFEGTLDDAELDAYIRAADGILKRREKHVSILDASKLGDATPYSRSRAIEFQTQHRDELAELCVGSVFVLRSPVLRFVAMTILMVTRLPTPFVVRGSLDEALEWAERRLEAAGVSPSGSPAP